MPAMAKDKQDRKSEWIVPKELVAATTNPDLVTVPARLALAIDGAGAPVGDFYTQSLAALFGVTYALKFARKKSGDGTPFKVAPLEGRWSAEDWSDPDTLPPSERWRWRLRLCVPGDVTQGEVANTIRAVIGKKKGKLEDSTFAAQVFLEKIPQQRCGRILHVGPYADEPRSFALIKGVLDTAGLVAAYHHLEIYMSDPRRVVPARLKTVLLKEAR